MIGGDIHDTKHAIINKPPKPRRGRKKKQPRNPLITVIVPAHNEEKTIRRCIESVYNSTYKNIELIVVNDSSEDRTQAIASNLQRTLHKRFKRMRLLNIKVRGKAKALNHALKHARGELFMCLDADSALVPDTITNVVADFKKDKSLACVSSHVKIFEDKGALNLFQRIEYAVCYEMKKTQSMTNTQYIVGGIGSTFRTKVVRKLGGYDTDTITEDIDLSMKIINAHGTNAKIGYNPKAVVYTEAVADIAGLLRQRYRWKYGRYQTFLKHSGMFLSRDKKYNPLMTWLSLPFALISEFIYLLEPFVIFLIIGLIIYYGDATMLAASFLIFFFYTTMHVTRATENYTFEERLQFVVNAPFAYLGMYTLSFVEYVATVRGLINTKKLFRDYKNGTGVCEWKPVNRRGQANAAN